MRNDICAFVGIEVEGKRKNLRTLFIQGKANSGYVSSMISKFPNESSSTREKVSANKLNVIAVPPELRSRVSLVDSTVNIVDSCENTTGLSQDPFERDIQQVYFGATYKGKNCSEYSIGAVLSTCKNFPNLTVTLDYSGDSIVPALYCLKFTNLELMISVQRRMPAKVLSIIGRMATLGIADRVQIKFRGPTVVVLPLSSAIINQRSEINEDILL